MLTGCSTRTRCSIAPRGDLVCVRHAARCCVPAQSDGSGHSVAPGVSIEPLALHPWTVDILCEWFETEWPEYYGAGGPGSALRDLRCYANQGSLPVGVVALNSGTLCGVAALKAESLASHAHLSPWAAAGFVHPSLRGRGIGGLLLAALEEQARKLAFARIYCGTSTAQNLLQRCGWELSESILHEGKSLGVFSKAL